MKHGHEIAGREPGEPLLAHGDSFVAKCDSHHPTDVNLPRDAIVTALRITGQLSEAHGDLTIWRQWQHQTKNVLAAFSKVRRIGRAKENDLKAYLDICEKLATRISISLPILIEAGAPLKPIVDASAFVNYANIFVDQIRRGAFLGETIPHDEKIFSVFEPHTRWISKGKAGRPVELGVPVCILVDRLGFVLQCEIMWEGTDVDYAVPLVEKARKLHPDLSAVGLDRGFHSPENRNRLEELLDCAALPKKGRPIEEDKARERGPQFAEMRRLHPAVESQIAISSTAASTGFFPARPTASPA